MRISDWSSDVCSSDLVLADVAREAREAAGRREQRRRRRFLQAVAERAVLLRHDGVAVDRRRLLRQFVRGIGAAERQDIGRRSEEHTSELQSLMRISYAVFCLKKKKHKKHNNDVVQLTSNDH